MNSLVICSLVLHGGSQTAFRAFRPFILHLLELVLTRKLVEVAICIAYLVTVRCVARDSIRAFLAVTIHDVLREALVLQSLRPAPSCRIVVAVTHTHQLLNQLFLRDLLAIDQFFQQQV